MKWQKSKQNKVVKKAFAAFTIGTLMMVQPLTAFAEAVEFRIGNDGKSYWYEDGVLQGTYDDPKGVLGDGTVRGREIYDPATNAWYWLDSVYGGAKAVGKEVWIPYIYQNEASFSEDDIVENANYSDEGLIALAEKSIRERTGKWVRYDENGKMLKGWVTIEGELAECYPEQKGNVYYYDHKTGFMVKGNVTIEGKDYFFNETTGVLETKEDDTDMPSVEKQVLYSAKGVTITATGLEDTWNGPQLNLLIENNSSRDVIVESIDESVNGYMIDSVLMAEVEAGSSVNDGITFQASSLEESGVKNVATMEFKLQIQNSNWSTLATSKTIKVDTSIAGSYQQKYDDLGNDVMNKNGVRIVEKGVVYDSSFGTGVVLYIEDNSDKDITVQISDVYVNGIMMDGIIAEDIAAGKKAMSEIIFFDSDLQDNDITNINEVQLYFNIINKKTGDELFVSDKVIMKFQ